MNKLAILAVVAAVTPSSALFGASGDRCPHWVSVMPLVPSDAEAIAADAVRQGEKTIINGIAWCCSVHPQGDPAADIAAGYAETYRRIVPLVKAKSCVKHGILLQSTMGHGGFPGRATPWQLAVRPDGTSPYRMCPLDRRFLDYIAKACRTFAALKPDFFMVDDDTRLIWGDVPGCFCPLHLAAMEKATGRSWSREELVAALQSGEGKTFETWEKVKAESLADFFRVIRANFPPEIPGMLCVVRSKVHFRRAKEFAGLLAAPGQTPVVRANGANYCGNDLYHVFQSRSGWAYQLNGLGQGVVCLQEADTCPQTLWSCSAAREYENMLIQALEGVKGAKIWITRLHMTGERRSQAKYLEVLSDNRGLMEWAAKADFRQRGIVQPFADRVEGFAERYLAFMGVPYRYGRRGKGEAMALCADNLERMTREEIEDALSGPLLIDGSAALWLSQRGYSDDIGVKAKPWALRTVQSHVDENGAEIGAFRVDELVADLTDRAPGTKELSRFRNRPFRGADPEYLAPGSTEFRNSRGGHVVVMALPLRSNRPRYYEMVMFSEGYKNWTIGLLERLCGGVPGGAVFAGAGAVMCEAGSTADDRDLFVLDPFDVDDLIDPEMRFDGTPSRIERLGGDGVWRDVTFSRGADGTVRLADTVRAKKPAVYRWKAEEGK